jgi:hypothetical protein
MSSPTSCSTPRWLPPINRSGGRNVHFYDDEDPTTVLGGLILTNGVTNANFYWMVNIIIIFTGTFFLRDEGGSKIEEDDNPFQPGNYYIVTAGGFLSLFLSLVIKLSYK